MIDIGSFVSPPNPDHLSLKGAFGRQYPGSFLKRDSNFGPYSVLLVFQ
ncbi:hypothetical protein ADIS_3237 [Lunatimonas lonarensis]|uniref:Uncharacterized protein n=1 Tax=Lunatimonas lonarensis TaxID=1232681 RepID=R7ZQ32_9BACT|nr:hypothetical protein ADIS_3237 [Lunatimonas lonarensis]